MWYQHQDCYNKPMPKDDTKDGAKKDTEKGTKKDAAKREGKRSKAAPRTHKNVSGDKRGSDKSGADDDEAADSDSSNELEAVKTKKGEPDDNLGRRAEWFQKRHS